MLGTDHLTCRGGVWFFVSFRIFFSDETRVRIFIFFAMQSTIFFFQNLTLGYKPNVRFWKKKIVLCMAKKINILTLVSSEKKILNETKNHTPPLQVKWSVPYILPLSQYESTLFYFLACQDNFVLLLVRISYVGA
jgi:hypothetical protein